jgi:hypothetical protein
MVHSLSLVVFVHYLNYYVVVLPFVVDSMKMMMVVVNQSSIEHKLPKMNRRLIFIFLFELLLKDKLMVDYCLLMDTHEDGKVHVHLTMLDEMFAQIRMIDKMVVDEIFSVYMD